MLDLAVIFVVILGSLVIGGVAMLSVRGFWSRLMLLGILAGLLLYSGIGGAYKEVPSYYLLYYFGFLFAFCLGFWFWRAAFFGTRDFSGRVLTRGLANIDHHPGWLMVIWVFLLLHLFPLVYPDFRLHWLLTPPALDIVPFWTALFQPREMDTLLKVVEHARLLLTPFFYIALFRYRERIHLAALIFALILYIQFVDNVGYIARGQVVMTLALIGIVLWVNRPRYRSTLVFGAAALLPVILVASYMFNVIRIGGTVSEFRPIHAIGTVLEQETSFVRNVGMPIIESGKRVDLAGYLTWIVTLPIPNILTGEIEGARVNYEIAEFILGIGPGEPGWYIPLAGLVSESVFIFGPYFFWIHAIFVAFLAALLVQLIERTPQLLFLQAYVVLLFAFVLNRAGIGALLPEVVNVFMLFYLYVFVVMFGLSRKRLLSAVVYEQPTRR